jgi:excinuclease ABC subunit B
MIEGVYDPRDVQVELRAAQEQARYESMSEKQLAKEIRQLEKRMLEFARNLEFEKAAEARDQLAELKKSFFGATPEEEQGMRAAGGPRR